MALLTYIKGLGATHLFTLDNAGTSTADDEGSSGTPTNITGGNYTFTTDPVCEGVTHSLDVVASINPATSGAIFANKTDINDLPLGYASGTRTLILWCKQGDIQNPTCIYEQGGALNNFAFMGGALTTFQSADSGQPFLIVQSRSLAEANRPYLLTGVWEYHTQHAGSGNRVLFYINGVLQGISELNGTDVFPEHAGDIACGNTLDNLQSYAGTTYESQTTGKNCNYLGMFNNVSLTQAQSREIFERSTFADVTIVADTVANQQTALDLLIGNTYENTNCAIRIIQATDATDYRLFIDNIAFNADANLEDISIQFVGTGILTVENTNGTVIQYTSAPPEVETTATTHTGGGSIVVVTNTQRVSADQTITNSTATKLVFDGAGTTYTVSGGDITEFENVSGNAVTVTLIDGATLPTLTETNGTLTVQEQRSLSITGLVAGSRIQIYNVTSTTEIANEIVAGTSYSLDYYEGVEFTTGDTVRLRATNVIGLIGHKEYEAVAIAGTSGFSFLASQVLDPVYNSLAIDGSTITKFSADYANDEIDIIIGSDFLLSELYAWWEYTEYSEEGIRNFFGGLTGVDEANFNIHNAVIDIKLDNTTTTNVAQLDNRRLYRDDLTRPVANPTSGGGGIDVEWRSPVLLANSDIIEADLNSVKAKTDQLNFTGSDVQSTASNMRGTDGANTTIPPTVQEIIDGVWDEPLTGATHNDPTSAGRRLRQASTWVSAEGEVVGTPTTTTVQTDLAQATSSFYSDQTFIMITGALAGQARVVSSYNGTTKTCTFDEPWTVAPSATDEFAILADHVHSINQIQEGLSTFDHSTDEVTTNSVSREASKADVSALGTHADLEVINTGVKKASKLIPHNGELP